MPARCSSTGSISGSKTWQAFLAKLGWRVDHLDKVICHQVGTLHRDTILKSLGIPAEKDFSTFEYLGNIGTVSLPLTAALAEERDHLRARRQGRLPRDRQRPQLHDAGAEVVAALIPFRRISSTVMVCVFITWMKVKAIPS